MIKLNLIFQDDMIFQAEKPIRLFGYGQGRVTAKCGDNMSTVEAKDGKFVLTLPMQKYGDSMDITVFDNDSKVVLHRVLFGDVYLFSGQSNMAFKLRDATEDGEIFESEDIRIFSSRSILNEDRFSPDDGWVRLSRETAYDISAIAYFSARELYKNKKRPIGIITAHQGASVIESWMSYRALEELNIHLPASELFGDHFSEEFSKFNKESFLYNLDILPILQFSLAAVIWYQGESNCGDGECKVYDKFLAKLIASWRADFCDCKLPFVIIQIADFDGRDFPAWHEIQKRQEEVCKMLYNCHLVVSRDVCETDNIHPPTKHLLAARVAEALRSGSIFENLGD